MSLSPHPILGELGEFGLWIGFAWLAFGYMLVVPLIVVALGIHADDNRKLYQTLKDRELQIDSSPNSLAELALHHCKNDLLSTASLIELVQENVLPPSRLTPRPAQLRESALFCGNLLANNDRMSDPLLPMLKVLHGVRVLNVGQIDDRTCVSQIISSLWLSISLGNMERYSLGQNVLTVAKAGSDIFMTLSNKATSELVHQKGSSGVGIAGLRRFCRSKRIPFTAGMARDGFWRTSIQLPAIRCATVRERSEPKSWDWPEGLKMIIVDDQAIIAKGLASH